MLSMGCLKLTYQNLETPLKVVYKKRFLNEKVVQLWLSVDPLADKYPSMSPYMYCAGNPIKYIDPDGMNYDIVIYGENNSSVTIKTDLINVSVDASSIVGDLGGNYTFKGDDVLIAGLDIVGIVDPTPISDGLAAGLEVDQGNYGMALLSGLGIIPYVGDLGKIGKIPKHLKTINKAIDAVKNAKSVTAKTFKEADDILFGAFPNVQKIKGAGKKSKSKMMSQQRQSKGINKDGKYHKDFKKNENGNIYGHDNLPDNHPHKTTPHINIKTPSGKKTTIYIDKS